MGNSEQAIDRICAALDEQERDFMWLSRKSGIPYKRVLAEIKHKRRPLTLETALAAGAAVGITLPELVEPALEQVAS